VKDWNYKIQKGIELSFVGTSNNPNGYWGYRIIITPQPAKAEIKFWLSIDLNTDARRRLLFSTERELVSINPNPNPNPQSHRRLGSLRVEDILSSEELILAFEKTVLRVLNLAPGSRVTLMRDVVEVLNFLIETEFIKVSDNDANASTSSGNDFDQQMEIEQANMIEDLKGDFIDAFPTFTNVLIGVIQEISTNSSITGFEDLISKIRTLELEVKFSDNNQYNVSKTESPTAQPTIYNNGDHSATSSNLFTIVIAVAVVGFVFVVSGSAAIYYYRCYRKHKIRVGASTNTNLVDEVPVQQSELRQRLDVSVRSSSFFSKKHDNRIYVDNDNNNNNNETNDRSELDGNAHFKEKIKGRNDFFDIENSNNAPNNTNGNCEEAIDKHVFITANDTDSENQLGLEGENLCNLRVERQKVVNNINLIDGSKADSYIIDVLGAVAGAGDGAGTLTFDGSFSTTVIDSSSDVVKRGQQNNYFSEDLVAANETKLEKHANANRRISIHKATDESFDDAAAAAYIMYDDILETSSSDSSRKSSIDETHQHNIKLNDSDLSEKNNIRNKKIPLESHQIPLASHQIVNNLPEKVDKKKSEKSGDTDESDWGSFLKTGRVAAAAAVYNTGVTKRETHRTEVLDDWFDDIQEKLQDEKNYVLTSPAKGFMSDLETDSGVQTKENLAAVFMDDIWDDDDE